MASIVRLAYAILDGTLIRIDRLGGTANRRYYAGKPRHHAVNVQVIADRKRCWGRLTPHRFDREPLAQRR